MKTFPEAEYFHQCSYSCSSCSNEEETASKLILLNSLCRATVVANIKLHQPNWILRSSRQVIQTQLN